MLVSDLDRQVPTRVLLITDDSQQQGFAQPLAGCLIEQGHSVHVCELHRGTVSTKHNTHNSGLTNLQRFWRLDPRICWQLSGKIQTFQPDVIHCFGTIATNHARLARSRNSLAKLVISHDDFSRSTNLDRWIHRFRSRPSDVQLADGVAMRDAMSRDGIDPKRIRLIPPPVTTPVSDMTREEVLAGIGLPEDARMILSIDTLTDLRAAKRQMWAFELVRLTHANAYLLFLGCSPRQHLLEQFRRQLEMQQKTEFVEDPAFQAALWKHADFAWSVESHYGVRRSVLRAMAAAKPIVAVNSPANREVIVDNQSGMLLPQEDRAAHARALCRLIEDSTLGESLAGPAKEILLRDFSLEAYVQACQKAYESS